MKKTQFKLIKLKRKIVPIGLGIISYILPLATISAAANNNLNQQNIITPSTSSKNVKFGPNYSNSNISIKDVPLPFLTKNTQLTIDSLNDHLKNFFVYSSTISVTIEASKKHNLDLSDENSILKLFGIEKINSAVPNVFSTSYRYRHYLSGTHFEQNSTSILNIENTFKSEIGYFQIENENSGVNGPAITKNKIYLNLNVVDSTKPSFIAKINGSNPIHPGDVFNRDDILTKYISDIKDNTDIKNLNFNTDKKTYIAGIDNEIKISCTDLSGNTTIKTITLKLQPSNLEAPIPNNNVITTIDDSIKKPIISRNFTTFFKESILNIEASKSEKLDLLKDDVMNKFGFTPKHDQKISFTKNPFFKNNSINIGDLQNNQLIGVLSIIDSSKNLKTEISLKLNVVDITKPTFSLNNSNLDLITIDWTVGTNLMPTEIQAFVENIDDNSNSKLTFSTDKNSYTSGIDKEIKVRITDESGNFSEKIIKINPVTNLNIPYIDTNGNSVINYEPKAQIHGLKTRFIGKVFLTIETSKNEILNLTQEDVLNKFGIKPKPGQTFQFRKNELIGGNNLNLGNIENNTWIGFVYVDNPNNNTSSMLYLHLNVVDTTKPTFSLIDTSLDLTFGSTISSTSINTFVDNIYDNSNSKLTFSTDKNSYISGTDKEIKVRITDESGNFSEKIITINPVTNIF